MTDADAWTTPLPELIDLLELAPAGTDRFAARHARVSVTTGHVFGGLVAAQALVAAGATVDPARLPHSMHTYFLRPGNASRPLHLEVGRSRDGRSFSQRQVVAVQDDRPIAELSFSFAAARAGLAHQVAAPAAEGPAGVRPDHEVLAELPGEVMPYATTLDAFEVRTVGLGPDWFRAVEPPEQPTLVWMRATGPAPEDPLVHAALLVYASDMRILHPALRPHGRSMYDADVLPASIDHAVWFHRPVPVDQWLLWRCDSPWAGDGRALVRASVYDGAGTLVASAAQEGLIRVGAD
ncbi:acyl-CoA thioesterase [Nocardioides sp. MH1]|uniref:acyl-CoA thioesterase n=1 Tax=Nocardioides sp. MH1 TaxID=3242490 RepID=UPI00352300B4